MEGTRRSDTRPAIPVVFHHIPKTAGTTLNAILRENYGETFQRIKPGHWKRIKIKPGTSCVSGHLPYGVPKWNRAERITILRDPVARSVSLYRYILHTIKHKHRRKAQRLRIAGLFTDFPFADLDNGMVRWLSGRHDVGSLPIDRRIGAQDYRLAIVHLRRMHYGFMEDFADTVLHLAQLFDWRYTIIERRMVGKRRPKISGEDREIIARANRYDADLYAWARERGMQ